MRNGEQGFTLVELMVVVIVVGVLAALALFTFGGQTDETRVDTEVHAVFAEMQLRQEQFHVENGRYQSTGTGEGDTHPANPSGPSQPNELRPYPDTWDALRFQSDKNAVYCAYVSISGAAGDDSNVGTIAADTFGFSAPSRDWYYVLAECDADGDDSENSFYFSRSDGDRVQVSNDGS